MDTFIATIDPNHPDPEIIRRAGEVIRSGGLVAFPTETVYGLGGDALSADSAAAIYAAKGRPSDNPLIVHIADMASLERIAVDIPDAVYRLARRFWPGPLTMIMRKSDEVPHATTGGLDTVAVRLPDNEIAQALISASCCPIAAPSANLSGGPSPTRAKDVIADMMGRVDAIIEGDDCRVGIESTVLDLSGDVPTILRPGIITAEAIEAALGREVKYDASLTEAAQHVQLDPANGVDEADFQPKSPGMKYKHYAPKAEMLIVEGERNKVKSEIERLKTMNEKLGNSVGVILFEEKAFLEAAHDFFARLRDLDSEGVDMILAGALSDSDGVGFAVMNRMLKSAGYNIVKV